jgi:hypothetical protein
MLDVGPGGREVPEGQRAVAVQQDRDLEGVLPMPVTLEAALKLPISGGGA